MELGSFLKYAKGKAPTSSKDDNKLIIYLSPEYLRNKSTPTYIPDFTPKVNVCDGDILLLWDGSNAGEFLLGKQGVLASTMVKFIFDETEYNRKFLFYQLKAFESFLRSQTKGSGIPHVDRKTFLSLQVSSFRKTEQKEIEKILSCIDNAISQMEQLTEKYGRIKKGLIQDLLTKGIDKDGKVRTEATHEFEEKEGYKFPKEWQFTTVEKSIQLIEQGWSPNCDSDPAAVNEWGILKTTSVTWDGYNEHENKRMPNKLTPKTQYEVKQGDVLITRAGPNSRVGVVSYVAQTRPKLIFSDKIYRITPKKGLLNQYLALALSSDFTQRHLSKFKTGMAESQTNISQKIVKALFILIPEPEEQMRIIEKVDKMDEALKVFSMDLEKLQCLKRGLSQDLLTGKVSVTKLIKDESAAV